MPAEAPQRRLQSPRRHRVLVAVGITVGGGLGGGKRHPVAAAVGPNRAGRRRRCPSPSRRRAATSRRRLSNTPWCEHERSPACTIPPTDGPGRVARGEGPPGGGSSSYSIMAAPMSRSSMAAAAFSASGVAVSCAGVLCTASAWRSQLGVPGSAPSAAESRLGGGTAIAAAAGAGGGVDSDGAAAAGGWRRAGATARGRRRAVEEREGVGQLPLRHLARGVVDAEGGVGAE